MSFIEDDVRCELSNFLQKIPSLVVGDCLLKDAEVSKVVRITDGWENDVYSFKIENEGHEEELILRIYPGDDAPWKSKKEFNVMRKLYEVGFPVPKVYLLELDNSPFGKPFVIMEKINGQIMWQAIGEAEGEKRRELITQFCKMFVDLHALDWRLFAPDIAPCEIEDSYSLVKHTLSEARKRVNSFRASVFAHSVLNWLSARSESVPLMGGPSVIHGDYHPANIILKDDGSAFVIDWGNFDVNDFRFDLAWTLLLVSTYGHPEAREIVLNEYERIAGHRVEQIEYFEVFAIARRLFSILMSISNGANRLGMRPGAEAMMKRNVKHIETVYALLRERTGITAPEIETLVANL